MTATLEATRQTPWFPDAAIPQIRHKQTAGDRSNLREVPPEAIFNPRHNYTAPEIAELAHIDAKIVQDAADAKEISCVCSVSAGYKNWTGDRVANWLTRIGAKCLATEGVYRQYLADERGKQLAVEAEQRRRDAEAKQREAVAEMFRTAAKTPGVIAMLQLLAHAEREKMSTAALLHAVESAL